MKQESTLSEISLNRIQKTPDIPNLVAGQIIDRIARGILKPGDKLPSEFEMTKSFGISRLSLREAMKLLEAKGYIESRGRKGKFVQDSSEQQLETKIEGILQVDHKKIWELLAVRRIVDSEAAKMAAENATKTQLDNLKTSYGEVDRIGIIDLLNKRDGGKLYAQFYSNLADATNNTIYAQIMKTISNILRGALPYSRDKLQSVKNVGQIFYKHHCNIIEAIERKDGEGAKKAVLEHLDWLEKSLKRALEEK